MATPVLTPDQLDAQASRLHDTQAWQRIVSGWESTAPEPVLSPAEPPEPVVPGRSLSPAQDRPADWRSLLSVPVGRLIDDSLRALPAAPPPERPLPGRLGAVLPDHVHAWRRVGQRDLRPSVHLGYARQVLTEWGWQNAPYRLRNTRGARCICGAMLTAHRLGYGSPTTVNRAGAWLITELRSQGWPGLIGPWNRAPGRTAADALSLLDSAARRASLAGH
ncbi:hypothetical protein PUR33_05635 [Streptomyces sp. BE282]|uniref:DUF6197 family protein n=1 Tax=Streptomyces TaxID=1883 RepID=UPI000B91983C|nr:MULTISPECIES: hypothetical protein [Streptomyces]MEE1728604.1 hypothetical protein [Streptomyces sp. BE282]OXY85028.1 hypothetical protein BEH93_21895 [Streptomyces sp. 2R]WSR94356.1 hypothetical protein OG728_29960 [Streptomyces microflavus]WTF72288.1 hypothetical protein OH770_28310 [Streptomyces microflavus]